MRVLVVKTSSMGDVIHTLPALADAMAAMPSITFDWVVEEAFTEIPAWHPAVDRVIPVAIRRWRKSLINTWSGGEWRSFKRNIRKKHYDCVIDAQGLLKSAFLTRLVEAPCYGYDRNSIREPLASMAYKHKISVSKEQHAVERVRELFASSLGYEKPTTEAEYGLTRKQFAGSAVVEKNVVLLHGTTWPTKHWPAAYWRQLAEKITAAGYRVLLPWGNDVERDRAKDIAVDNDRVEVLPRLDIKGVATALAQASAVVSVDTGLGHLSAAIGVPTLSLYSPTDPQVVGTCGANQYHYTTQEIEDDGSHYEPTIEPANFASMTPERVWQRFQPILLASED
ncbi:heptosyltransferase-1 [Sinobacterium caligoides]|uniref:Lipopolysaccharide heptosyltransferase 1 n=1 Tax=Sinobacterium caligoides TaxID=933926 RepID=A0A3N2DGF3_9GAMM|nr:lipopolysaccharide heptosyltransferase I [Sinobacterium caligoides]ROR98829.1 heptosyltransferase-1 [Sinobacterium caligoides]